MDQNLGNESLCPRDLSETLSCRQLGLVELAVVPTNYVITFVIQQSISYTYILETVKSNEMQFKVVYFVC